MPDRLPALIETHRAELAAARGRKHGAEILVGKSMGSRVGCHLALEESVDALVCFGYPLIGAGKRPAMRDEVLLKLTTPILFVQGTRDSFGRLDLVEKLIGKLGAGATLLRVEDGDHSFKVRKSSGQSAQDVERLIHDGLLAWLKRNRL